MLDFRKQLRTSSLLEAEVEAENEVASGFIAARAMDPIIFIEDIIHGEADVGVVADLPACADARGGIARGAIKRNALCVTALTFAVGEAIFAINGLLVTLNKESLVARLPTYCGKPSQWRCPEVIVVYRGDGCPALVGRVAKTF